MVEMPVNDGSYYQPVSEPIHMVPLWVPILVVGLLIALPVSVYLAYSIHMRRKRAESHDSTPANTDVEKQTSRPSTGKWSLAVPRWTPQAGSMRRGSDGGFPPGTRHISFPDPTLSASVDSLDHKAPPSPGSASSVVSPVTLQYPTPPPAAATRQDEHYYARGHAY